MSKESVIDLVNEFDISKSELEPKSKPKQEPEPEPKPKPTKKTRRPKANKSPTKLSFSVTKPSELQFIDVFLYGETGSGKTTLVASAQEVYDKVLVISTDYGTRSIFGLYDNIDVIEIGGYKEAKQLIKELMAMDKAGSLNYSIIILDTLSALEFSSMEEILLETHLTTDHRDKDLDQPELQDYGKNRTRMLRLVNQFRSLRTNTIVVSQCYVDRTRPSKPVIMPNLSGKLVEDVPSKFNLVWYLEKAKVKNKEGKTVSVRKLYTENDGSITAKDRTRKLPKVIYNPTYTKLHESLNSND